MPLISSTFTPRLKQGYGAEVIYILNCFADKAIEKVEFPNQPQINIVNNNNFDLSNFDGKDQNEYLEEDEEDDAKYLFENQQYTLIDDDEEDTLSLNDPEDLGIGDEAVPNGSANGSSSLGRLDRLDSAYSQRSARSLANKSAASSKRLSLNRPVMKSTIDSKQWSEEYEQMLPQLRLANRMLEESGNNWRIRFDELKKRNNLIKSEYNQCNDGLGKLELEVQKSLDRLESRERYVQQQMDALCNELLAYRSELNRSMENYQQINGGVISKSRRLAELSETIQKVKADTEKREQSLNDKTPLVSIRQALSKLRMEINELNIRIGVAFRNVMHQKVQRTEMKNDYKNLLNSAYPQDSIGHLLAVTTKESDLRSVY